MNPSTIGWVSTSLLVPIGAAIFIAKRKKKNSGVVQTYPKAAGLLMFTLSILALFGCVYLVVNRPEGSSAAKYWARLPLHSPQALEQ